MIYEVYEYQVPGMHVLFLQAKMHNNGVGQYIQRIYSRIQSHVLDFQKAQHTSTSKGSRHSSTSSYHIPVPGTRSSFTYLPHLELPTRVSSAVRFAAGLLSHNELLLYE